LQDSLFLFSFAQEKEEGWWLRGENISGIKGVDTDRGPWRRPYPISFIISFGRFAIVSRSCEMSVRRAVLRQRGTSINHGR